MKIKEIHVEKFKRFSNLTIRNIPSTAKLIVLLGPNGCGKSSLFDAFKAWHLLNGYGNEANNDYCKKDPSDTRRCYDLVGLSFHDAPDLSNRENLKSAFYFRTAYRNSPEITISSLQRIESPLCHANHNMMIQNDSTVNDNYQRLISQTLRGFYNKDNDEKSVKNLRDELLDKVRQPLNRLFPDLLLTEIGMVTDKAEFYFSKGNVERYGYEKLSGGEKAAFDLLLDLVIKGEYYKNSVFCIDEPETHVHTSLQAKLLEEMYKQIPDQSQLWIATHSFGMLKQAKNLKMLNPNEVVFLNFDGYDFDDTVVIEPSECDAVLWNKMLEITLDDYSEKIMPDTIVFCEGTSEGRKRKDFDARCYTEIFKKTKPSAMFFFVRKLQPN